MARSARQRLALMTLGVLFCAGWAAEICEIELLDCPESYNGDTILVPETVIGLSPNVHACKSSVIFPEISEASNIPSIMFVIDNSGSMKGTGSDANDQWGSRYTVTRALLDTIYKVQPNAEVGVAVFSNHLLFDPTTQDYFSTHFQRMPRTYDGEADQAFLPLMRLNRSYGGRQGIQVLKDLLAVDTLTTTSDGQTLRYVDLRYQPNFDYTDYTNINIGFLAAREAFASAANPPEQQFVIFLSDGEPRGDDQAGLSSSYFSRGDSVPTTFTVYFTGSGGAPSSLTTMTDNIRDNGYSATNPQSALWTIETNHDALMQLFMEQIMTNVLVPGSPTRMVVNGTRTSTTFIDSSFAFGGLFPIEDAPARFSMDITYRYTDQRDRVVRDSTIRTAFYVKHQAGATVPANVRLNCITIPDDPGDSIPVTATLRDTSGDGHLDLITLSWTDTASIRASMPSLGALISQLRITTFDGTTVDLNAVRLVPDLADRQIHIVLRENTGPARETGWQAAAVRLTEEPMAVDGRYLAVTRVVDGAGPVVYSVTVQPGASSSQPDLLHVTFSEPVDCEQLLATTPAEALRYYHLNRDVTDSVLAGAVFVDTSCTGGYGRHVTIRTTGAGREVVVYEDSLQLVGGTVDQSGNQPPRNGRKAPVTPSGGNEIVIAISPNPFIPGRPEISSAVAAFYENVLRGRSAGTVVGVGASKPLKRKADGSYGEAELYDAVGNLVRDDLKIELANTSSSRDFGIYWDGANRHGRFVGAGGYLLVIRATDIDGNGVDETVKIGVKR